MIESRELKAMRNMAWERAKGELFSMLITYYSSSTSYPEDTNYEPMKKAINLFIKKVEDNGLQE